MLLSNARKQVLDRSVVSPGSRPTHSEGSLFIRLHQLLHEPRHLRHLQHTAKEQGEYSPFATGQTRPELI